MRSDYELFQTINGGGPDAQKAMEELLETYKRYIYKIILAFPSLKENAEDIFSDIIVRLLKSIPGLEVAQDETVKAYVGTVARHHCIDEIERRNECDNVPFIEDSIPGTGSAPHKTIVTKLTFEYLKKALLEIGEKCKRLIIARTYHEIPYEELLKKYAARSEGALREQLSSCKKKWLKAYIDLGGPPLEYD
jgi:RNA polymerase sigma factor (sigma-70 family)